MGVIKQIVPALVIPTPYGIEIYRDDLDISTLDRLYKTGQSIRERILQMSGSDANYLSKKFGDLIFGATAYSAPGTLYCGLWTAALDDTFNGATSSEAAYTSYARLSLTNNTTIFAAGSGTTTYTKTWPSDTFKNFATSTGGSSTVTYFGVLDGNAGSSSDKGIVWASVTSVTIANGDTPQLAQNAVSQTRD